MERLPDMATDNEMREKAEVNPNLIPFKPGQSGNPKGLPKGTKWLKPRLREMIEAFACMPTKH